MNSIAAEPSAPVSSCGCQKAVSAKFARRATAAGSSLAASPVTAIVSATPRLVRHALRCRRRSRCRHRAFGHHRHHGDATLLHSAHRPTAAAAGATDPPGRDLDEGVARKLVHRSPLHPRFVALPERTDGPEIRRERRKVSAGGEQAQRARRCERGEEIEAPVVHRGQELRRAGLDRSALGVLHGDAERLARSGRQPVAEGRELDRELLVLPRHLERGALGDELVVGHQG